MKTLFTALTLGFFLSLPTLAFSEIKIKQKAKLTTTTQKKEDVKPLLVSAPSTSNKVDLRAEKVITKPFIMSSFDSYPASNVQRPLMLPLGLIQVDGLLGYHYLTSGHIGANLYTKARYSHFQDWEFSAELSAFPQTQLGFEFGGIRLGFLYHALMENTENPEVAVGIKGGFLGKGYYSLTKDNTFSIFPNVSAKKQLTDHLGIVGELMLGIGNKDAGIASLNATGYLKATPEVDIHLKLDIQNLGYQLDEIIALTPGVQYHLNKKTDIFGGMHLGLLGTKHLGNNVLVGMTSRF